MEISPDSWRGQKHTQPDSLYTEYGGKEATVDAPGGTKVGVAGTGSLL